MPDNEPRSSDRKLGFIAPLSIALVVVILFAVIWVSQLVQRPEEPPAPPPPPVAPAEPPPPLAPPPPPLARAGLLEAADTAASEFAAGGAAKAEGKDPLVGRSFLMRLSFGCAGPQVRASGAQVFSEYDAEKKVIRLVARPAAWTTLPLIQSLPDAKQIEAVEGFWIPHPWTAAEACLPPREGPAPATPTPPAPQTLGLARIFETGGSRVLRRGERAYEQTIKVTEDEPGALKRTYWLVLEGRLVGFADGRAIRCWSESPDHRPVCLYAVEFDRVAFEDGATGELLAEWRE